jgi:arylsulfatase A-like enzyme
MIKHITAILLSGLVAGVATSAWADRKPNILVIVSDDHGYGDVGAYGCKDIPTPNLDSLATRGVRCTGGYVSGPYCSPTRAGLLTGRYQTRFGHEFNPGPAQSAEKKFGLPLSEKTMADRLKAAGYVTGMVGKWHLGYEADFHPMRRGFDEFFGFLGGGHSYTNARADRANPILRGDQPVHEEEYLTDAFGREALEFIDRHSKETWFLYLTFNAVHTPLQATQKYLGRFTDISEPKRRTYAAMLAAMDDAIGAVLTRLRELELQDDTLIFFVSDNGGPPVNGSSNGPLRGHKAQTWDGGIRVPLMIQWTGHLPAGKVYDEPVIQLDFLPTALAAAGVNVPASGGSASSESGASALDGVNLLPYLRGEKTGAPHAALYWRFGQQMAIRMGDWKLVKAPGAGLADGGGGLRRQVVSDLTGAQLFNLSDDIGERNDLADKHPEKVKQLAAAWQKWNAQQAEPRWFPGRAAAAKAEKKGK